MKPLVLYIVFIINFQFSCQLIAQHVPNYNKIGSEIADEDSKFYYPKLFGRYMAADRELNLEDFRHLYYGFTFQNVYSPYADSEYRKNLAVYYKKKEITKEDREQMIKYANLILKAFPFDLRALQILDYAYYHNKNYEKSYDAEFKRKMIIKAIMSTGNGFTKESGIHIIDDLHKFDLISQLGFRHNGQKKLTNNIGEYLGVFENDKNITGLYFNLHRLYEVSAQKLKID